MSDLLKHIIIGDLIGTMAHNSKRPGIQNTASVFGLGVLSHAVMDMSEPDFTVNWFNQAELAHALPFLSLQMAGIWYTLRFMFLSTRDNPAALKLRMSGIFGAVCPDIVDGIYALLNPHAWYSGQLLFPWHNLTWQVNPMSMWATTGISACLMAIRYLGGSLYRTLKPRMALLRGGVK